MTTASTAGTLPHLHRDWAPPAASARKPSSPLPHPHRDWTHPGTSAPGPGSNLPTPAPGLGTPQPTSAPGLGLRYNCSGVDRLLCCDQKLFTGLAAQSCGSGFVNELLVVHNNDKYGGAGGKGMGTTSVNAFSPKVPSCCRTVQRCATCCSTAQHAGSRSINPVLAYPLQEPSRRNHGLMASAIGGTNSRNNVHIGGGARARPFAVRPRRRVLDRRGRPNEAEL